MGLIRLLRWLRWYLRELTGESQYEHYLARHHRTHPGEPVLTRRDFERWRVDRADVRPGTRCC